MTGAAVIALTSGVVGWFATRLLVDLVYNIRSSDFIASRYAPAPRADLADWESVRRSPSIRASRSEHSPSPQAATQNHIRTSWDRLSGSIVGALEPSLAPIAAESPPEPRRRSGKSSGRSCRRGPAQAPAAAAEGLSPIALGTRRRGRRGHNIAPDGGPVGGHNSTSRRPPINGKEGAMTPEPTKKWTAQATEKVLSALNRGRRDRRRGLSADGPFRSPAPVRASTFGRHGALNTIYWTDVGGGTVTSVGTAVGTGIVTSASSTTGPGAMAERPSAAAARALAEAPAAGGAIGSPGSPSSVPAGYSAT